MAEADSADEAFEEAQGEGRVKQLVSSGIWPGILLTYPSITGVLIDAFRLIR